MEFSIISSCLGIVKVFPIILPSNLVNVQRLHEKGNFLCVFNGGLVIYVGCSFMNVRYFACFEQRAPCDSGNNRVEIQSKRRMLHDIRTHC